MTTESIPQKWSLLGGTFLICFSLLAFEILTVRTINFAIGPSFIFIAISLAMLGLTSAGSILSALDLGVSAFRREYLFCAASLAIAALLLFSNVLVVDTKAALNAATMRAGESGGLSAILPVVMGQGTAAALMVGIYLCLPYFLFGALLSYLFATSRAEEYANLYAADLIGAAAGCVAIVAFMELTSYALSVTVPAIAAVLAAAAYVWPLHRSLSLAVCGIAAILAVLPQSSAFRAGVEPSANPNYLVRDYDYSDNISEVWSRWNSFTRVGVEEWADNDTGHATVSLSNGDGMAYLYKYLEYRTEPLAHKPAMPAMLLEPVDDALVLFAGVGADLMSLKEHGVKRVTGVELNPTMVEAGLAMVDYHLAEFLHADGVRLEVSEGRAFLERDQSKYDMILLSWSGATIAYYLGALAGTTQGLFTYEGLSAVFDHLTDNGHAIILQVSKVNVLAVLRRYMDEHGLVGAERAAIVLYRDGHVRAWDGPWDDNPLLIKLGGWSDAEIERITTRALEQGMKIAYAPGWPLNPEYGVYQRLLTAPQIDHELEALRVETSLRFNITPDDRPFYMDSFLTSRYLSSEFWFRSSGHFRNLQDVYHHMRVIIVIGIAAIAFLLAIAPLAFIRRPTPRRRSLGFLLYFLCLGAGFMFLEIGLIQRANLLFGNPGLTIAIVLCSIIMFTGIGSLMSNRSYVRGLSFRLNATAVAGYAVAVGFGMPWIVEAIIGWTLPAKVLVVFLIIAPGAILMGHMFPQGIALAAREDRTLVPWAWAINGAMSASIAGIAPLVAQAFGFRSLFLIGAGLYLMILLIPVFAKVGRPARTLAIAE